jgi:anthranilate phosphoribosyltransferase
VYNPLQILGTRFALVVHCNGLDEISITGITKIYELKNEKITEKALNPEDYGIKQCSIDSIKVPDAKASAVIIKNILNGKETGLCRDIVVLNSAAALIAAGLTDNFSSAVKMAQNSIDEEKALHCLENLVKISNSISKSKIA